ncbi:MAG TPA: tetratricopeptide repeat protein, partial [Pontiella sp.]|nr:tetratricopeptide repeat protein [Pontiella sp.]
IAEWALQVPVPQNSSIHLLCNGFCAYFEQKNIKCGAEVFTPEPGVLWGRISGIPDPVLTVGHSAMKAAEVQWLETDNLNVLLQIHDDIFCLITRTHVKSEAEALADDYFSRDFEDAVTAEFEKRAGALSLFEDLAHRDALAVLSVESMMKALRPPEGRIPLRWSQTSDADDRALFNINELFPLALAWSRVDTSIAEELVLCAFRIQTNAGAIPVHFSPHTTYSVLESPKPLLIKTAETVWEVRKDPAYLETILPLLRRHMQWLLHHFDPKRRNIYCWKNRNEPIVVDAYESDMATVDLAVLLVTEIEALNRMLAQSSRSSSTVLFSQEHTALAQSITDQFWNDDGAAFTNAYIRDVLVPYSGFPAFSPLLWRHLPGGQKQAVLEAARESERLPGQLNVLSWRQSSMNHHSYPLLAQFLVFTALRMADPHGSLLRDFSRLTLQGFLEWHTLSLETDQNVDLSPAAAAFIVNIQSMHSYRYHSRGSAAGKVAKFLRKTNADRTDLGVIIATLVLIFSVHLIFDVMKAPPPLSLLETQMNSAYAEKDGDLTLQNCTAIIEYYPESAARARLLAANILIIHDEFESAAALLKEVRKEYPDAPGAMVALGLALQLQGRFEEAEANYYEFCYLFNEIFPEIVAEVNKFRYLMKEGFRTPPKWQEIYRYQFMHEL